MGGGGGGGAGQILWYTGAGLARREILIVFQLSTRASELLTVPHTHKLCLSEAVDE